MFTTDALQVHRISSAFQLLVEDRPFVVADPVREEADRIWQESIQSNRSLFDGTLLAASDWNVCHPVPYRYFFAQRKSSTLKTEMNIVAVCVSGLCLSNESVLLAKRSHSVTQYPGFWELAPSGSLSPECVGDGVADYRRQLLQELQEEVGIESDEVQSLEPFALILDQPELTLDICCVIKLPGNPEPPPNREYSDFQWLPVKQVAGLVNDKELELVPTSRAFLQLQFVD